MRVPTLLAGLLLVVVPSFGGCQGTKAQESDGGSTEQILATRVPAPGQPVFETPSEAVEALFRGIRARDRSSLRRLFGIEGRTDVGMTVDMLDHGQPTVDEEEMARLDHDLAFRRDLVDVADMPGVKAIVVGHSGWVFPVPLMQVKDGTRGGGWFFDGEAAANEFRLRRIGLNELRAIAVCQALVAAQQEYFAVDRDGDGVREYAQRIMSTPDSRDGLSWPTSITRTAEGEEVLEEPSPVGPALAQASSDVPWVQRRPYHGYFYRMLRRQGPGAPGGAIEFAPGGQGTGGFAFLAFPAVYGVTGVATFMVGQDGVVYEFDLGPDTLAIAEAVEIYDPQGWKVAE